MNQMKKEELEITISDSDRIECAIRHIQTAVDVDPWAVEIAVEAMETQLSAEGTTSDLISRRVAIDAVEHITSSMSVCVNTDECHGMKRMQRQAVIELANLPSAQPEIDERTEEFAQNVPKEDLISRKAAIDVAENAFVRGLLASPDIRKLPSVQPVPCEDAVSRDSVKFLLCKETCHPGAFCPDGFCKEICEKVDALPSATPKQRMGEWIPVSERLPEELEAVIITWKNHEPEPYYSDIKHKPFIGVGIYHREKWWWWSAYAEDMLAEYGDSKADRMDEAIEVTAWMPLPEPYRAERRTDGTD